jgi:hypothetical protein
MDKRRGTGDDAALVRNREATMRLAIAAIAAFIGIAAPCSALAQARECWNPHAGHYEAVRPGERQDDLDRSRCRHVAAPTAPVAKEARECWNPGAKHFERVRPGERQNDLDFSRCHVVGYTFRRDEARECWNPHAGHFERVRPGERQNDLDFARCRRI